MSNYTKDDQRITEVNITPIKANNGLIAFANVVFDNSLFLGSIGIHTKLEGGYRLTYPTKTVSGREMNLYHPINKEISELIETAVIKKLKEIF